MGLDVVVMVISPEPETAVDPVALPILMFSVFSVTPLTTVIGVLTEADRLYVSAVVLLARDTDPEISTDVEVNDAAKEN